MARVVVLGAGVAGMTAAMALRRGLGPEHRVLVLAREDRYVWRASLPWVAVGLRRPEQIMTPVRPGLARRGIDFRQRRVLRVEPRARRVVTAGGHISYDYLLIALGPQQDWDAVPGAAEHGHILCRLDGAQRIWSALQELDRGTAVIAVASAARGALFPTYEMAFLLEDWLRESGRRRRVKVHFITVERGLLEVFGPTVTRAVQTEFAQRGIAVRVDTRVQRVDAGRVWLADGGAIRSDFTLVMPPYRGSRAMQQSPDLVDGQGFVQCGPNMQHPRFANVFTAGDGVGLDVLKTGYHAEQQAKVAAQNIVSLLQGGQPTATFRPETICDIPLDRSRALLGFVRPAPSAFRNLQIQFTYTGRAAIWFKTALEQFHLWRVR